MMRHHQLHTQDVDHSAQYVSATPAALVSMDDGTMPSTQTAPRDRARQGEQAIRAMGLDGIVLGGATIRRMRRTTGLSTAALADSIGCSGALVRAWETGRRICPPHLYLPLLDMIARARDDDVVNAMTSRPMRHASVAAR